MPENYKLSTTLLSIDSPNEKRWVKKIIEKVKEKIFWNNLKESNIEEFKRFNRLFGSLYDLMKEKFSDIYRTTWERYFEHLRAVVNNVLDLPNPTTEKVLIAIAHDSIEDTNKTFEWLSEDYWYKVALWVQTISKNPWEDYLTNDEKNEKISLEFNGYTSWTSDNVNICIDELNKLKKIAKERRNLDYFSHLKSFESLLQHINSIAISKWINLTDEKLKEITHDVLDVKLADRIHNLSTQWNPDDLKTTRRKIEETKKYFLIIAKEHNPEAYKKLIMLINDLKYKLENFNDLEVSWKVEDFEVSWNIDNILVKNKNMENKENHSISNYNKDEAFKMLTEVIEEFNNPNIWMPINILDILMKIIYDSLLKIKSSNINDFYFIGKSDLDKLLLELNAGFDINSTNWIDQSSIINMFQDLYYWLTISWNDSYDLISKDFESWLDSLLEIYSKIPSEVLDVKNNTNGSVDDIIN